MAIRKAKHLRTGELGEKIAERYLRKRGWKVLKRNWRRKYGEIDIVARDPEGVLVCVEVKTARENKSGLAPEDYMRFSKKEKVTRAARGFVATNQKLVDKDAGWRIDVVAVTLPNDGEPDIAHYENIVA